jgi:acetoin utilization deacetylase AcuC-like enzyme
VRHIALVNHALYLSHPDCAEHDPSSGLPGHPDAPARLQAIESELRRRGWLGWRRGEAPAATATELSLVHAPEHVRAIEALCRAGGGMLDADTYAGERSWDAALRAAGAACQMARELIAGEADVAFCATRPPGHHAEPRRAMGFCLFNNVAIAAQLAVGELGVRRALVLDWDVHHGNGTAEAFRRRGDVLYASIHQRGIFPGTGALEDCGSGEGEGATINLPVPAGAGEELWLGLLTHVLLPAARAFEPELVLVSAGFDAHREDPLADCVLQTGSFAEMARHVAELARSLGAPLGAVLEGGYDPPVLADCVAGTLAALAGDRPPARAGAKSELVAHARSVVGRHCKL